jgi:tetrahydromethanopterin S-methyltransferase subunit C
MAVNRLTGGDLAARLPTAPLAAAGLIAGFAVAAGTGSRPLGGAVMAAFGLTCVTIWLRRDGRRTAATLTGVGLFAFAFSHLLGLLIGAWPSVLAVSAATAISCRRLSDSRRPAAEQRGRVY